jgi:two-component SAPR family response regulator
MNREVYYDSIAKDNEYERTSLNNSGSQKNTMDLNTIEEKRLSKVVLIVDELPKFYDLMLINISMRTMNGIDLARQLLDWIRMSRSVLLLQERQKPRY